MRHKTSDKLSVNIDYVLFTMNIYGLCREIWATNKMQVKTIFSNILINNNQNIYMKLMKSASQKSKF